MTGPGICRVSETQRVEDGDRPGTHREDVAQDAPDSGCRPLVRLHGRRVVVRFDLERDCQAVADVDHARVLARPGDDVFACRRERCEQRPAALVRTVLAPHDAEHRELEVVRIATEAAPYCLELVVSDAERPMEWGDFVDLPDAPHGVAIGYHGLA